MNHNPGTEVVAAANAAETAPAKAKKIVRVAGAAVFSFAMFGAFALPAYALNAPAEAEFVPQASVSQSIKVTAGPSLTPIDDIPLEVDSSIAEQEQRQREVAEAEKAAEERAKLAANQQAVAAAEAPAGKGDGTIVGEALAQLGVAQDCTDLVQNALAGAGITTRRDQGGYDHGVGDFGGYGASVGYDHGTTALAPGDLLVYGGAHVAVYIGNGQAVHGGWDGFTTVVAGLGTYHGLPTSIVRMS